MHPRTRAPRLSAPFAITVICCAAAAPAFADPPIPVLAPPSTMHSVLRPQFASPHPTATPSPLPASAGTAQAFTTAPLVIAPIRIQSSPLTIAPLSITTAPLRITKGIK